MTSALDGIGTTMFKMSQCKFYLRCLRLATLLCLLACLLTPAAPAGSQDATSTKVEAAIALLRSNEIQKGMATLKEIGSPAVPYVLAYLSRDRCCSLIRLILMGGFVSRTKGPEADTALIALLSDEQPELRGYAASELGDRKVRRAIPRLISRLDDMADTRVVIDMNDRRPNVPVRDEVIAALESVTGITLASGKNKKRQVEAWRDWWQKHKDEKQENQ